MFCLVFRFVLFSVVLGVVLVVLVVAFFLIVSVVALPLLLLLPRKPPPGVPGMDLDMPDPILISPDLRNHQKHPKQRKNVPKQKVIFFLVPYLPIEAL